MPRKQDYEGCTIPPDVYDAAFGWDPAPEVERMFYLARQTGVEPKSCLELGCGTGRLLREFERRGVRATGLELSPSTAAFAARRTSGVIEQGDMTQFNLGRTFDLVYCSANTIRHVYEDAAVARMWRCVADHLCDPGAFIADLEFDLAFESDKLGKSQRWAVARADDEIRFSWTVVEVRPGDPNLVVVEWAFETRGASGRHSWRERFMLRAYGAEEFLALATGDGRLALHGFFEMRDPYLFETPIDKAAGRALAVLKTGEKKRRQSEKGDILLFEKK